MYCSLIWIVSKLFCLLLRKTHPQEKLIWPYGSVLQIQKDLYLLRGEAEALRIRNDKLQKRNTTLEGNVKLLKDEMYHMRRDACTKQVIVNKLKDSERLKKDLAASVRGMMIKAKVESVLVESATRLGENTGSRPVLVRLGSPSDRPRIFEKSKVFVTMGLSVMSDRWKL